MPSRPRLIHSLAASAILLATTALLAHAAPHGYDTPDHAAFQRFVETGDRKAQFSSFKAHLQRHGVADVVPPWTLWRQGTDWRALKTPAFAVPPEEQWPRIVPTLRVLSHDVIPLTGPVEVVSGFRTAAYNQRAGGASGSRHKWFEAVDVVPARSWERGELHTRLLRLWSARGPATRLGLGLYARTRFHVDTHRHRRW